MTAPAQPDLRPLVLAIGLAVAPLLRRRLPPQRRQEILDTLAAVNVAMTAIAEAAAVAPGREADQAMARWALDTFSGLSGERAGLAMLEEMLKLCDALGVEWPSIVGAVNGMSDHRHSRPNEPRPAIADLLSRLEQGARAMAATLSLRPA